MMSPRATGKSRFLGVVAAALVVLAGWSADGMAGNKHQTPPPPPPPPPPPTYTPATYSGDAQVVDVNLQILKLLGLKTDISLDLVKVGPLPPNGGVDSDDLLTVNVVSTVLTPLALGATVASASTVGTGYEAFSNASVADVNLGVGPVTPTYLTIQADVIQSDSFAACKLGGGTTATGSSTLVGLKINNVNIVVTGKPNQTINLSPLIKVVINEQIKTVGSTSASITVNALHIYLLPPKTLLSSALTGEVIISHAHSDIGNCQAVPPPCEATNSCPPCEVMGTCPPCVVDDFITGGGQVWRNGSKVSFSSHGGRKGTQLRNGHLNMVDKAGNVHINTGDFFDYKPIGPVTRELYFYCGGVGNGVCKVTATDKGEPGKDDNWFLNANGYSAGDPYGVLKSGNIQLHKPRGCPAIN